jgi:hypothetical protein
MDVVGELKKLNLPLGQYVVVGSAVMAIHGIGTARDIDLVVSPGLFKRLRSMGWHLGHFPTNPVTPALFYGLFEAGMEWSSNNYQPNPQQLIQTAQIINGIPYVSLDEVLKWKTASGRKKDLDDIRLIKAYLMRPTQPPSN